MELWFLWGAGVLAYLLGGVGTLGLSLAATDGYEGGWDDLSAVERWSVVAFLTLFWWLFCVLVGQHTVRKLAVSELIWHRERKAEERERAEAMQYRDIGTLDELDRDR